MLSSSDAQAAFFQCKSAANSPFLKARNSKMLCTMETTMVRPSRYGLVSRRATYIQQEGTESSTIRFPLHSKSCIVLEDACK